MLEISLECGATMICAPILFLILFINDLKVLGVTRKMFKTNLQMTLHFLDKPRKLEIICTSFYVLFFSRFPRCFSGCH